MLKITLTEALKELKVLDSRIEKSMMQDAFIAVSLQKDLSVVYPITTMNAEQISKELVSQFQSINDLMTRRSQIKTKLVAANNNVMVTIGSVSMTIADAIEQKNRIDVKRKFVLSLQKQLSNAISIVQQSKAAVDSKFEMAISDMTGSGKESKTKAEDFQVIRDQYEKNLLKVLVDPIGLETKIKTMQEEIDVFVDQVDIMLSIANSTNFIEV